MAAGIANGQMFAQLFVAHDVTDGLTAWYEFEQNTLDSASTNNGTWAGGGGSYVTGKRGYAADFSGNTSGTKYISCNAILIPATAAWTVEMWQKGTSIGLTTPFSQYKTVDAGRFVILNRATTRYFALQIGAISETTTAIPSGVWAHVVLTRSGPTFRLYVDGEFAETFEDATAIVQGVPSTIGGLGSTSPNVPFVGLIDEVRIYNRAITDGEVLRRYNFTK